MGGEGVFFWATSWIFDTIMCLTHKIQKSWDEKQSGRRPQDIANVTKSTFGVSRTRQRVSASLLLSQVHPPAPPPLMLDPYRGHISSQFNADLTALRDRIRMMSSLVERSLQNALAGLANKDLERCNRVIADDVEIDTLERELSAEAMRIILRFQPVALDLRVVVAAIKLSVNLERIADQAVCMARRGRKLLSWRLLPDLAVFQTLFADVIKFHHQVVEAFVTTNALPPNFLENAASSLQQRAKAYGDMIAARVPYELDQAVQACMDLVHIAKLLEQIVGICRDIDTDTQFAFNPDAQGRSPDEVE